MTNTRRGYVKGEPRRFIIGHNKRVSDDKLTYVACHLWLQRNYPKLNICTTCGTAGPTDFAFTGEPGGWARDRDQYVEECRPCHRRRDLTYGGAP
jgi:hypothetical protein